VLFNDWNRCSTTRCRTRTSRILEQLGRFTCWPSAFIIIAVYKFYLTQLLEMRWRAWMTRHYLQRWLATRLFTAGAGASPAQCATMPDNPDQRIQEDINQFTSATMSLTMGLLNAVVTLASFVGICGACRAALLHVAGHNYNMPGFMVWMAVLYCAGGQRADALHRPAADPAELPAAEGGGRLSPPHGAGARIQRIHCAGPGRNGGAATPGPAFWPRAGQLPALLKAQKNLIWFTSFFGQAAVVFPFHGGGTALFQRCHPAGRADADCQCLWPGARTR
jgi:putative ATP-binding cassette transporter